VRCFLSPSPKMLTTKCPPRDFRVAACANSTKNRLYRCEGNLRGRKLAGIREEFSATRQSRKFLPHRRVNWLCWQSLAKDSLSSNSLIHGKIQGNFPDLAAKARRAIRFPTISQLLTPKFPAHQNREFCRVNRELFPAEQGKSLAKSLNLLRMEFRKGQVLNLSRKFCLGNRLFGQGHDFADG